MTSDPLNPSFETRRSFMDTIDEMKGIFAQSELPTVEPWPEITSLFQTSVTSLDAPFNFSSLPELQLPPIDPLAFSIDLFKDPLGPLLPPTNLPTLFEATFPSTEFPPLFGDVPKNPFQSLPSWDATGLSESLLPPMEPPLAVDIFKNPLASLTSPPAFETTLLPPLEPLTLGGDALTSPLESLMNPPFPSAFDATSLLTTPPPFTANIFETALESFSRPIDFPAFNLTSPLTLDPTHPFSAPIENAPWLTPSINVADPSKSLADILEASHLTRLTNDLLSVDLKSTMASPLLVFEPVLKDFEHTSKSYADFIRSAEISSFDPTFLAIPARGYFGSGDTFLQFQPARIISAPLQRTRESAREDIQRRTESRLETMLNKIDPRLQRLWLGAHIAAASENPDRIRHACVSVRELMTHVLHTLAPDTEIFQWTSDPRRFNNGRPTRETRLLYICQPVAVGALSDYVAAEIKSVLALGNVFQKGTHGIGVEFSPLQLQLVFSRIEGALCSLIEISNAPE